MRLLRAVLMLQARRFRCETILCERQIFTELFDDTILKPWARRTARLDQIVHCLAIALGGRPAASFARRLSIPVSNTLLRAVRRRGSPSFAPPVIIGIDDWAWRRNHRYGTLICDLERRKTIALLPDREPATPETWLSGQPQIAVVARDRGGGYALAAQKALPNAVQVADRWHLMENASHAFLDAVRKSMRQIRSAIGAATINPGLLTAAKLQYEGYLRREETNATILAMAKEGATIKKIARSAGYNRGLVRKVLRGETRGAAVSFERTPFPHGLFPERKCSHSPMERPFADSRLLMTPAVQLRIRRQHHCALAFALPANDF